MHYLYRGLVSAVLVLAFVAPSMGRESDFPVPDTVSPQLQAMIGAGIPRGWDKPPRTTEEWKAWIAAAAEKQKAALPALREKLGVTMTHTVMAGVPDDVRIGALLAALPMMYTLASRVTFTHFDGSMTRLSGMTFVIGPAASGKSFILALDKLLMEPIRMADKAGRRTEQEYRDSKELNKNKQKQMEKPHPVIRITPIQISNTMLALRMRDAVDTQDPSLHLHVYSCEAELATALRAQKGGSWIEKNDLYCKSFHNEYWGMDYANDQAINGEIQVNLNLVISGTEDAFDRLIPTSTILSGLPTRLMYFQMPAVHYRMIAKGKKKINTAAETLLKDTAYYLDQTRGHVDATKLTDHMYRWCERIARRAEMEDDEELDDLRKRTTIIGERAGVAYALVAQREAYEKGKPLVMDKDVLAFVQRTAHYVHPRRAGGGAPRRKPQRPVLEHQQVEEEGTD